MALKVFHCTLLAVCAILWGSRVVSGFFIAGKPAVLTRNTESIQVHPSKVSRKETSQTSSEIKKLHLFPFVRKPNHTSSQKNSLDNQHVAQPLYSLLFQAENTRQLVKDVQNKSTASEFPYSSSSSKILQTSNSFGGHNLTSSWRIILHNSLRKVVSSLADWCIERSEPESNLRVRRDAKVAEKTAAEPEYGLTIHVEKVEASSNRSLDNTIMDLKEALAAELPWPRQLIKVERINFAGSKIMFSLKDDEGHTAPVRDHVTSDLLPRLSAHVPELGLSSISEEISKPTPVHGTKKPFWIEPYFPYVLAGSSVAVILGLSVLIYCCCCAGNKSQAPPVPTAMGIQTKKLSGSYGSKNGDDDDDDDDDDDAHVVDAVDSGIVLGSHSILYPSLKPELASPVAVQPDSGDPTVPTYTPGYSPPFSTTYTPYTPAGPLVTPIATQPVRIKTKGLLERRGSNASLTLDLNQSTDINRWEGTPPKESSALEFLMSAGNRLSRRDLRQAVKHTKILYEEFWEIPMNHAEKVSVAGSGMKNRYKTIIPNEHSRVLLPDIDNDPLNSYINANYIRGYEGEPRAYIATQGPMAHTVTDFWRMVWSERCPVIVMITKLREKSKPKCENYLPERWGVYGDIEVVIESTLAKRGYILRVITLRFNGESHTLLHYWYTSWPDHKPPDSPNMLLDLIKEVELRRFSSTDFRPLGPVCVHCSAGIGRTGCFIAISIGIRQLREEHSVDTLGIVCSMRIDRGGLIQTHEQYDFVHQALAVYERELGEPSVQSITALTNESVTTPP